MLESYLKAVSEIYSRGDAREESYYSTLEAFLLKYAKSTDKKSIHVTTLPKKTEAGNPDFRVWDGCHHIVGYIEAKDPSLENLDRIEETEQLKRYINTFPNLMLTNFYEFRLYRNGMRIDSILIGRPFVARSLKMAPPVEKETEFYSLLERFFAFSLKEIYDAKNLAVELAKRTRFLRDEIISEILDEEERKKSGYLKGFYEAFMKYLIKNLTKKDFADLYAQTITYGLFAARSRSDNTFNRKLAYDYIPHTIGILRDVFKFVSIGDVPKEMEWIIDDIAEVLAVTNVNVILHRYFHEGRGKDPIVHFYETFLAEYDPTMREKRGVYYTPESVVSFIVRSLHHIIKKVFNAADGFAGDNVTVLDPAAGTLTFLAEASKIAVDEFKEKYGSGKVDGFIKEHILKNFYAFELMMAPYAVGHLKMSFLFEELGYKLKNEDRFKLYLTNTLEMEELPESQIPGTASLSEESHLAGEVKKEQPILVIIGNPPYSVSSVNKSDFIEREMEFYKKDVRDERNIQPLSDDYIKFIRFAHWKIEKTGKGVIGMITNNSYLSGLIHRGMRKKLLESFNEIYILNLHGNSRIGERCPDGSKDENVFDIMQGVAIALFIKDKPKKDMGRVYYQDIFGIRNKKYDFLENHDVTKIKWIELEPSEPYYFFVEKDFSKQSTYEKFWSVSEIFNKYSSGVTTHRDHFVVGFTKAEIKQRIRLFTGNLPDELVRQGLDLKDTHDFNLKKAREKLRKCDWEESILPYSYRPFDDRFICYSSELIDRDRHEVMQHFEKENLGLAVMRQYLFGPVKTYNYVFCVNKISDRRLFISNRGAGFVFPLYLYPNTGNSETGNPIKKRSLGCAMMLFESKGEYSAKKPNLSPKLIGQLGSYFGKSPTPEKIFYYIYAILYSNIYRTTYAEFLKIDFPRIPFTKEYTLFNQMAEFGERLVGLHLMKSPELDITATRFQGIGNGRIERPRYDAQTKRLYINLNQYFEDIPDSVWDYQIGGYQICDKWLKDRKGRDLSLEEIKHYCKVVTSIKKTMELQPSIDKAFKEVIETI